MVGTGVKNVYHCAKQGGLGRVVASAGEVNECGRRGPILRKIEVPIQFGIVVLAGDFEGNSGFEKAAPTAVVKPTPSHQGTPTKSAWGKSDSTECGPSPGPRSPFPQSWTGPDASSSSATEPGHAHM